MLLASPSGSGGAPGVTFPLMPLDSCSFGGVTLGKTDTNGVEWFFLDIDGWGAPQSSVSAVQRTSSDGAFVTPSFYQARVVTVSGAIFAPSRPQLIAARDQLNGVGIQPIALTVVEGGHSRYANAIRQSDIQYKETSDVSCEFTIQWICPDYRKFDSATQTAATGLPSSTGGLAVPFTVPFSIGSTITSGSCSLTNAGNVPGPVTCRFIGPLVGPQVTHTDAAGNLLVWGSSISLGSGDYLDVNMDDAAHTAILNGSVARDQYTTSRGWAMFTPGVNQWTLAAASGSGSLQVTATAAYA